MIKKSILLLFFCSMQPASGLVDRTDALSGDQKNDRMQLVYLSPQMQTALLALSKALPNYKWSSDFKNLCKNILRYELHFAEYEPMRKVINESLNSIASHERTIPLDNIKSDIQEYEEEFILSSPHATSDDVNLNENYRANCSLKEICNLGVRFLHVTGGLRVEGSETINGMLNVNGPLLVNGAEVAAGTVTFVNAGTGIIVTGNPAISPIVNLTVPVSIANGGTNATSMTNVDGVVYYDGTLLNTTGVGVSGQILTSRGPGMAPVFVTGSGGSGIANIDGNTGAISGATVTIEGGNNITTVGNNATVMTVGVSGTTDHAVQIGNGTGSLSSVAVGATNTVLLGNTGADPSFGTVPNAALTNSSITLVNGTGISVSGSPVSLGGSATINLSTPISIANGGTNATSMTNTDGVVYYDGTKLNTTTVGTSGQLLTSNGTGFAPTFQTFTITADSGSVSGHALSLSALNAGNTVKFSGSGSALTLATSDSNNNTAVGEGAGNTSMGSENTVFGESAATRLSSATGNCVFGQAALLLGTSGGSNCVFGQGALQSLLTGESNIAIGSLAGSSLASNESNNIYLAATGVVGESSVLRINQDLAAAYIGGISGTTVVGSPVLVSTTGQLGVAVSSRKYKKNIEDIDAATLAKVLGLRAVTFNYKESRLADETHYGLIAEEVAEVMPNLVVYDKNGEPQTIKYHELPILLLAQIKALSAEIEMLKQRK